MAAHLGMTKADMLDRMSAVEYAEWRAFASKEPFGEDRQDVRMAVMASFLGNVLVALLAGKRGLAKYVPKQFLHDWWDCPEERAANLLARFKALSKRINKREEERVKGGEIGQG